MDAELRKTPLWPLLVETARSHPLYRQHKSYVGEVYLPKNPGASAEQLAEAMRISLGEALVILSELEKS